MYQAMDDIDDRRNQRALLQQLGAPGLQAPAPAPAPAAGGGDALPGMAAPPQAKPKTNASIDSIWGKMTGYAHTPQGLQQFFGENPDLVQGASIMGSKGDKIRFGDGSIYDVIQSAGTGGTGWQRLWDNDPNARQSAMGAGLPAMQSASGSLNSLLTGDPLAAIQAAIAQYQKPQSNLQALLQQLEQGR